MGATYHHGDLPTALLEAVDGLVREHGVAAVTLREAARRAGVSHAAPAHHFRDKAGLLTAYAAQGFAALRAELIAAGSGVEAEGGRQVFEMGLAYIRFAVREPGRFTVMFRPEALRAEDPAYREACEAAFAVLREGVAAIRSDLEKDSPELLVAATGAWSLLHGLATLWLDGNLAPEITARPPDQAAGAVLDGFAATVLMAAGIAPAGAPVVT